VKRQDIIQGLVKLHLYKLIEPLLKRRRAVVINLKILFGVNPLNATYTKAFFKENIRVSANSASLLIKKIVDKFPLTKSVVDLGCGNGIYLNEFTKNGIESILGVDGSKYSKTESLVDRTLITKGDLRYDMNIDRKFDVALCIEVAEHLDSKYADQLVENITRVSNLAIFTAAPPGQGGVDHVNERPKSYWISMFNKRDFTYDQKTSEEFSQYLMENKAVSWLSNNLMIFKKEVLAL